MIGAVQDNKFMLKAIKGEALIVFGRFDGEDDWKRLFDQKEKDSKEYEKLLDPVIVKRSEKFFCTTFDELDKCGNETLEHILKKTKELQLQVGTILNYRKYNRKGK